MISLSPALAPILVPSLALTIALVVALPSTRVIRHVGPQRPADLSVVLPQRLRILIEQAGLASQVRPLIMSWCALAAGATFGSVATGVPGMALFVLAGATIGTVAGLLAMRHRRDRLIEASLPAALEAMARSVRSGATFAQAVGESSQSVTGPLRVEFAELHRRLLLGQGFSRVVDDWAERRPLPGVRLTCAALEFSHDAGGVRSRAIDGVADSLRDEAALVSEIAALASQARMSAMVVAVLPLGFVGLSSSVDKGVGAFLFGTPLGFACLGVGVTLDVVGFLWMRQMTRVLS